MSLHRVLALLCALWAAPLGAFNVRMAVQDTAPKFIRTGDAWGGICVDLMRAIEFVDAQLHFMPLGSPMPLSRIESQLELGSVDVSCALARTPKRSERFDIIDIPLYFTFGRLAARSDDPVMVSSFDDLRRLGGTGGVLVVEGSIHRDVLSAQEVRFNATPQRASDGLRKLLDGSGRLFFHNDFALWERIRRDGLEQRVRILPVRFDIPGVDSGRYFMVSKKAAPELRQRLQAALTILQNSGELARIFESFRPR